MTEKFLSDIEIAQQEQMTAINNIANKIEKPDQNEKNKGKNKAKNNYR